MRGANTDGRTEGMTACQQQQPQSVLYEAKTSTKDYFLVPFKYSHNLPPSLLRKQFQLGSSNLSKMQDNCFTEEVIFISSQISRYATFQRSLNLKKCKPNI